jgi:hypothetical protein
MCTIKEVRLHEESLVEIETPRSWVFTDAG